MPKAFPPEFRDEVVRVARRREQSLRQTAIDFGISESCLNRWLALDEIETGDRPNDWDCTGTFIPCEQPSIT